MGWSYDEVLSLPHDVYLEAVAYVIEEVQKPQKAD